MLALLKTLGSLEESLGGPLPEAEVLPLAALR